MLRCLSRCPLTALQQQQTPPRVPSSPASPALPPSSRPQQDYKEFLEDMVKPEDKNATPFIQDYKEYHTGGWGWGWVTR